MFKRISRLIDVKSLVTLTLTMVFSVLSLRGEVSPEQFLTVFTVVISFYFGTQLRRAKEDTENDK